MEHVYTYIYQKNQLDVGKYTMHGSYGRETPYKCHTQLLFSGQKNKYLSIHIFFYQIHCISNVDLFPIKKVQESNPNNKVAPILVFSVRVPSYWDQSESLPPEVPYDWTPKTYLKLTPPPEV